MNFFFSVALTLYVDGAEQVRCVDVLSPAWAGRPKATDAPRARAAAPESLTMLRFMRFSFEWGKVSTPVIAGPCQGLRRPGQLADGQLLYPGARVLRTPPHLTLRSQR